MQPVKVNVSVDRNGIKTATRVLTIVLIFFLYLVADYIRLGVGFSFLDDANYWATTIINMVLIISIMLVVRSMRKDVKLQKCQDILDGIDQIQKGFNKITIKGFSSKLDIYLEEVNKENKYQTFLKQTRKKLLKYSKEPNWFARVVLKKDYTKIREKLNQDLESSKEDVVKKHFRYKPITVSKLFSSIDGKVANDNEYDIDTYENADVSKMIGLKAFFIILFSAFTCSLVADFFLVGWSALYSTLIKVFSLTMSINTAMNTADDFVEHNIRTAVQRRLSLLAGFVNATPELKELLKIDKQQKDTE